MASVGPQSWRLHPKADQCPRCCAKQLLGALPSRPPESVLGIGTIPASVYRRGNQGSQDAVTCSRSHFHSQGWAGPATCNCWTPEPPLPMCTHKKHFHVFEEPDKNHMAWVGGDGHTYLHSHTGSIAGNQQIFSFRFNSNG